MYQIQSSLNQIATICSQLSQNEQGNVNRLAQMEQAERSAAQQLRQCAQMCHQVAQQVNQMMSQTQTQFGGQMGYGTSQWSQMPMSTGQYTQGGQYGGYGTGGQYSHWSNVPVSTANASFTGSQQYGGFQGQEATGTRVFNTNNDLRQ